ncbi:MAG: cytochrome c [Gemmatimonadota bacterium]|nr:cytochrome c [Gemmatimonadota bacterium]
MPVSSIAWAAGPLGFTLSVLASVSAHRSPAIQPAALPDTNAISPDMVNAGRRVFHGQGTCFACHGMNLEGGPVAPTLKAHAWKDATAGDLAAIYKVVIHGVSGTLMVSHPGGISDGDAVRVATYIWSVSHRGAKP